jgi:type III secretion protein D
MKRLRILTGKHAGASLDLTVGNHSIGFDHDSDISITDWTFTPLRLVVSAGGDVVGCWFDELSGASGAPGTHALGHASEAGEPDPTAEHPAQSHRFVDFEPRTFQDIVLCLGPVDQTWPSDLQLLDKAFHPSPKRGGVKGTGSKLRTRAVTVLAGAAVLALCVAGSIGLVGTPQAAKPPETLLSVTGRVQQAMRTVSVNGLQVKADQNALVVSGMVENTEQASAVRNALGAISSPYAITQRYSVASDVAESIRSTVGLPSAQVKYMGDGVFAFAGDTADPKATRQAIDRVAADLTGVVRRIEVTLEQTEKKGADIPILSSLKDDDISVVQTRDGQKHLVVVEVDPGLGARKALSIQ